MKSSRIMVTTLLISIGLLLLTGCQKVAKVQQHILHPSETTEGKLVTGVQQPSAQREPNGETPKITFEKEVCDLGQVGAGTQHSCEFKFKNTGKGKLQIGKVQSTCGCTVPKLDKYDYAPGESGVLKVIYSVGNNVGKNDKKIYVSSNDSTNSKVTLITKAEIIKKVDFQPEQLKFTLKSDDLACPKITLRSIDGQSFSIKQFKSTGNCITDDVNSPLQAKEFTLEPKIDITKLQQYPNGRIEISITHPECKSVAIPFRTILRFEANPSTIAVFNAEPNKPVVRETWIINNYNEDFEIESVSSSSGCVKLLSKEKSKNRYKLRLEMTSPVHTESSRVFADTLTVVIKGGEKLEIKCRGFYSKAPMTPIASK